MSVATIRWEGDRSGHVVVLDQTRLPLEVATLEIASLEAMVDAIRRLAVRGAPAIGLAGAFGLVIALQEARAEDADDFVGRAREAAATLAKARPTAVNLAWALERMLARLASERARGRDLDALQDALFAEARTIAAEEEASCARLGELGAELIEDGATLLTHCNAGSLVTVGIGTALAPIYAARAQGKRLRVYADETRPLLQGARLTAWELHRAGVDVTLIADGAAGSVLARGAVDAIFVGADRIALNGDVANKVGTYPLAVLAARHRVPFYVVAPLSTFDARCPSGADIPIEQRPAEEVTTVLGRRIAPEGVRAENPAFDVTPAELIAAIITEHGRVDRPDRTRVAALLREAGRLP